MIIERFQQQVKKFPGKLAVKTQTDSITYEQLDRLSNHIANNIKAITGLKSKNKNVNIGVLLDSAPAMIAAIFGILKSGNTYVPLISDFPLKRVHFIIQHAEIDVFIIDNKNKKRVCETTKDKDMHWLMIEDMNTENPGSTSNLLTFTRDIYDNTDAYLLYTSGSTGRPKGVRQTHRNILHFIHRYTENLEITSGDNLTLFSSFSHDAAVMDIYGVLLNGATLYPLDLKQAGIFSALASWLKEEKITVWHSVPTVYRYAVASLTGKLDLPHLRYVVLGGETVLRSDIEKFRSLFPTGSRLYNLYGQTESTYNSGEFFTAGPPGDHDNEITITLGEPVPGTELVVVDETGDETDPLELGEIIVISPHVSPGYWKDEHSSQEKFVNNPEAGRVYFTGDLGRCLPDGRIEYQGRKDHQVKIRGNRVELGEIESVVMQYPHIDQAVVIPVESVSRGTREIFMACYFSAGKDIVMSSLREFLQERLLDYMMPSYFRQLLQLPRTISGKIDRKALPAPSLAISKEYVAPANEIEKKLVQIWAELLEIGKEVIGTGSSFFELGGHSLKATLLAARIFKEFQVNISLTSIFERQTIKGLGQYIQQAVQGKYISIEPVEKKEFYSLSSAQKRLYFLQQMEGIGSTYNLPFLFRLRRPLESKQLEYTCQRLIQRHEILRTSFEIVDQEPVQRVHEAGKINFAVEYHEASPENEQETLKSFIRPFDLAKAPLMRMAILKTGNCFTFLGDFHHIIVDGISLNIVEADFLAIYDGETLPGLKLHYKDYTRWQHSDYRQSVLKKQKEYWLQTFMGEIPVLSLPYDYPRPTLQDFAGATVSFILKEKETMRLKQVTGELGVTLYMLLLAAYNVLLLALGNREDIVVGTPMAGRNHADLHNLVGMFVNTIIIRNYPCGEKQFTDFLNEVKQNTIAAYENQEFPFEYLVESLPVLRDTSRNPLFDVAFNLLDERHYQYEISESVELDGLRYLKDTSMFDLSVTVIDRGHGLVFRFEYSTRLFKPQTMERFLGYFKNILSFIAGHPGVKLSGIEILPEDEKEKILEMCSGCKVPFDTGLSIGRLFREQAVKTPDRVALVGPGLQSDAPLDLPVQPVQPVRPVRQLSLTYRELNERSHRLAHMLIEKGVHPDSIVGIMMERSVDMIIGILGILKADGAYLPIDTESPGDRIDFMLKDSNARILLKKSGIRISKSRCSQTNPNDRNSNAPKKANSFEVLDFETLDFEFVSNFEFRASNLNSSNLAYIIYTSGSTGRPKGVMATHRNVVRLVKNAGYIHYSTRDRLLPTGSAAFDISTFEIWSPLLNGVMLWLEAKEVILNAGMFKDVLVKYDISILHLIPQLFNQMAAQDMGIFGGLRYFLVGGDLVKPGAINRLQDTYPQLKIVHCYGPTENTTFSTTYQVEKVYDMRVPIGKPINNSSAYILDKYNHLQPVGVPGELCVGGDGTARGYLNNPELTFEKFDHDLWDLQDYHEGYHRSYRSYQSYIYRTGDLARWLPDGNIEFLGRSDSQVKVRGYRVELEEVESRLSGYPGIKEVVVVPMESEEGDKRLCAYFVPYADDSVSVSALREHLTAVLPPYMVPSYFVTLERMPLLVSGKIDRKALPMPDRSGIGAETLYVEPGTGLEEAIVHIWKQVLKLDRVGVNDHFFRIGGNSINILQVNTRLKKLNIREIPVAKMFQFTTIRELAHFLEGDNMGEGPAAEEGKLFQAIDKGKSKLRKRIANRKRS